MELSVADIAATTGGKLLSGNPEAIVTGFAALQDAGATDLSFFSEGRYAKQLAATRAGAVLVPVDANEVWPAQTACIGVADPSREFERLVDEFGAQDTPPPLGVHPSAAVDASAEFDPAAVSIGANAVIEAGVRLGSGVVIGPGTCVGRDAAIGDDSCLHANVTVGTRCMIGKNVRLHSGVVIGGDGFGYQFEGGRHRKINQCGIVRIDDQVEVGAGTTIDRARFGQTIIGEGTKIDNLVQIGHNVVIGKHCILVACVAIAGSARIGDYVVVAAQAGIAGHVTVGSQVRLGGRAGVTKDVPDGTTYLGFPAVPANEEKRRVIAVRQLPKLMAQVKKQEARIAALEERLRALEAG